MIVLILICILIPPELYCMGKHFRALREIFRRSSYDGRCNGIVLSRKEVGLFAPRRWEYTVKYTVNGETYICSFRHHEPDDPMQSGEELPVIYPSEHPARGCALHDTECFHWRTEALIRYGFLIAGTATFCSMLCMALPSRFLTAAVTVSALILVLSLLLTGGFIIGLRIFWHTQSFRTVGTVLSCTPGFRKQQMIRTVGYESDGESFVFTDTRSNMNFHMYQFGDPISIRYLKRAHFVAECNDQSLFWSILAILFLLLYTGILLYFMIGAITEHL